MKLLAVVVAGVVAFLLAVTGALVLFSLAMLAGGGDGESGLASQQALDDIPTELLSVYQGAAASCGMRWAVLAAVGKVETDHGRSTARGVGSGANPAGAMGPMQFLAGTWAAYGVDANDDATVDVYNPADAIWGAARYLCASGAGDPAGLRSAIWSYNHADWYVDEVLAVAAGYEVAVVGGGDARLLADNPNLSLTRAAREDLISGDIDQQVVSFLTWAVSRHTISVSVLRSGHSKYVADSARVSDHWYGRGVDIYAVDGELVTLGSPAARGFALEASALLVGRPDEIGVPWSDLTDRPGVFSDSDHLTHLHLGWSADGVSPQGFLAGDRSADGFRTGRPEHSRDPGKGGRIRNSLR